MYIATNTNSAIVNVLGERQAQALSTCYERLSSGRKLNRGADDPSGLGISTAMKSYIRGQNVAIQNIQDGINLMHVQDAALMEISKILNRMRDLSVRASNEAVLTDRDRDKMNTELQTLMDEVDRIASTTSFNGIKVLLGNPTTTTTDLEFAFTWWTPDTDLDMHVIQPDGAHAWYANQNPNGHGEIDVDDVNGSTGPADPAIEHYNVASGAALTGTYDLWINYYGENGGIPAAPLPTVTATVTISMYRGTPYENIQSFNVNCPYAVGDEGNDPWGGTDGVPPYGEVFVGSYYWAPLSLPSAVNLQVGPDNRACDAFTHDYFESRRGTLQISLAGLDSFDNARASIDTLDTGLGHVMDYLNTIGQRDLRLQHVVDDLKSSVINLSSANSRIEDADMAEEVTRLTIARIYENTQISASVYANEMPRSILTLMDPVLNQKA